MSYKTTRNSQGFTLIELLVVISIIGLLSALLLANMVGIRERSRDTRVKNDLKQLKTALRMYYNDNQSYPAGSGIACTALPDGNTSDSDFTGPSEVYMRDIPADADIDCRYWQRDAGEAFTLRATLRNSGDQDITDSAAKCGETVVAGENYYYECTD